MSYIHKPASQNISVDAKKEQYQYTRVIKKKKNQISEISKDLKIDISFQIGAYIL